MLIYLLILLIIIYVVLILRSFFRLKKVVSLISLLANYISSAEIHSGGIINKKEKYDEYHNDVLLNYPAINKYTSIYSDSLSYGQSDRECLTNSFSLYNELSMKRNYLIDEFKSSLNPINSIKIFFSIPSLVIKWIGFKPNSSISKILNLFCWIITYLLGIYTEEIKMLINSLFK